MNISIEIKAPELVNALLSLANSLGVKQTTVSAITNQPTAPIQNTNPVPAQPLPMQQVPQAVPTAPVQPTAPMQQTYNPAPVAPAPQPVLTTAAVYTMDQLAVAATQLMDAGRQQELLSLLSSFGANSLMALPQEAYGAFATKLREMGAKI